MLLTARKYDVDPHRAELDIFDKFDTTKKPVKLSSAVSRPLRPKRFSSRMTPW